MGVLLQDVMDHLEDTDREHSFFYDPERDRFVPEADSEECIPLYDHREIDDYGMMEDFITTVQDDKAAEWLKNAIKGRGAFRMFRATCDRFGLTERWYAYRERRYHDLAADWCLENGIAYEDIPYVPEPEDDEYAEEPETVFPRPETKKIRYGAVSRKNRLPVVLLVRDDLQEGGEDVDTEDAEDVLDAYFGDGCMVFAAMENGIPVGYIAVCDARAERLYVRPEYRRRGIGTALLKKAEENTELMIDLIPGRADAETFFRNRGYGTVELIRLRKAHGTGTAE